MHTDRITSEGREQIALGHLRKALAETIRQLPDDSEWQAHLVRCYRLVGEAIERPHLELTSR